MYLELLTIVGELLIAGSLCGCLYLLAAAIVTRRFAAVPAMRSADLPPLSVLKPLCGEDPGLYDNLVSFCRQEYPAWQVVFGVQSERDPAIAVVHRLIAEFPAADLTLVVEGHGRAGNLKIANLQNMLPAARHDLVVIADSDMRVTPGYLAAVAAPLADPTVGLVTCLYRGVPSGGTWSRLAALHINHGFLPQALVAQSLGTHAGCFGATLALRRETLQAVGGLAAIADALADDHALGAAVRRLGLKVVLSPQLVDNIIAEPSLGALFRHELRWARTIRAVAPAGFLGSVVTQPVIPALAAVALGALPVAAPATLAVALLCRATMVRMVDRALRLPPTPLWLVPLRDVLSFAVFVASFFTRTVAWRDRTFRIGRKGRLILKGDRTA
ncbi:MAG TPA: bacteriohopanetetrol glucosamine biosynthesis glycosyltransferase HpnI [Stellaceae bacterium]|nr:bacteriohopanetetrol glucosamine biosynthesis glycosyltransferase HpnI [Stellaceae bacterium]